MQRYKAGFYEPTSVPDQQYGIYIVLAALPLILFFLYTFLSPWFPSFPSINTQTIEDISNGKR